MDLVLPAAMVFFGMIHCLNKQISIILILCRGSAFGVYYVIIYEKDQRIETLQVAMQ
jgi:hypothetical protein